MMNCENTCMVYILLHTDDDCVDNPCGQYGTCHNEPEPGNFTCYCADGFSQSTPMGGCEGEKPYVFLMKHRKMKVE